MRDIASSLARSRFVRTFVSRLEEKVPLVRAWHRFEYQRHFAEESGKARMFAGIYESFDAAIDAIPHGVRVGYDHAELADRHTDEIGDIWPSDYATLFWLAALLKPDMTVFDLGGSTGLLFYGFRKYLAYPAGMRWTVCDVPAVASRGCTLAKVNGVKELSFTTRIEDAEAADVLLTSGSLQFISTPLWQSLSRLNERPHHLIINRIPLTDGAGFVTLQNIGRAICPYQIWNRAGFMHAIENVGFKVIDSWETPEFSCYIPFHPNRSLRAYSGMYCRLGSR
jgi:putative methyltransferase (TIGR04325 family)